MENRKRQISRKPQTARTQENTAKEPQKLLRRPILLLITRPNRSDATLRHKKLETTMHYLRAIVIKGEEEYTCKIAQTPQEASQIIESRFQHVQTIDGTHLYRKRK